MLRSILKSGYYEILKLLESKKRMPSEIAKILTKEGMSERTVYERFEVLKKLGLIDEEYGKSAQTNRPVKFYYLTDYGKLVVKKLEELEAILEAAKTGEGWIKVEEGYID